VKAENFYSKHLVDYDKNEVFPYRGYTSIRILEFLDGKRWDDIALAYVHAVRPSCIRVTTGTITLDAHTWRVTVVVDDNNIIEKITQEVEVGLPERTTCGESLRVALKYGIDSPQVDWYNDDTITGFMVDGVNGIYYKRCAKGSVPFPKAQEK